MDSENRNDIPTRKGVYLRNPDTSDKIGSKQTVNKTHATHAQPQKIVQQKAKVQPGASVKRKKTPAEIAREKEIAEQKRLRQERINREIVKEKIRRKKERKKSLALFRKKIKYFLSNVLIGALAAILIFGIIAFVYYRNMSRYNSNKVSTTISFYEYIDTSLEESTVQKKLQARQDGKESPIYIISEDIDFHTNEIYIPFSKLSVVLDLTESGDNDSRTILIGTSLGEYSENNSATFFLNSNKVKVNGSTHYLKNSAYLKNNNLFIPYEFLKSYIKGIEITDNGENNDRNISVTFTEANISFSASNGSPIAPPNREDYISGAVASETYGIDLSEYEKHINPANPDEYLILVDKNNKLTEDYMPSDLTDLIHTRNDREAQKMRLDAAMSLEAFLKAAYAAGHSDITVTSAYRSYTYQSSLFNTRYNQYKATYGEEKAEEMTAEFTAYPGASEHQSGLCCDMHNLPSAMQSFANTEAYKWLYQHSADFGFILRYPQSKEEITGINFEPWHFRFVGRYHAQKITESGLSLEEYLKTLE